MKAFNPFEEFRIEAISSRDRANLYSLSAMTYSAINFRALNISQIPMRVVKADGTVMEAGLLPRIFSRRMGYVDMMRRAELSYCLFGYNLFFKQRNAFGLPVKLQWMNPTTYSLDASNYLGLRGFRVTSNYNDDETDNYIKPHDAVFMNGMDLADDFDGVAPAEVAFASASAEAEMMQAFYAVFRNSAIPAAFVQPTEDSKSSNTQEDANNLTRLFRVILQGVRNTGRTIVSPKRWEWLTLQPPFRDMDTRHITDQVREQCAIAFGIPIELLLPSASSYAQMEVARRTWAHTWLVPHIWWYADALTEQLATEFGNEFIIEPDLDAVPFLKEDRASTLNVVNAKLHAGLITYGDAQKQLGEPVIEKLKDMVYSPVLNTAVPIDVASSLYKTINGAFQQEIEQEAESSFDDSALVFPENRPTVGDLQTPIGGKSWIPDAQYNELRAWKKKATDDRKYEFAPTYLRQDIVDFVERMLDKTDDAPDLIFANAKAWLAQKSIQSTRLDFENDFEDVLAEARNGGLTRRRFGTIMRDLIARYGRSAYRDGLIDGGIEDAEMDADDFQEANSLIAEQSAYVTNFANKLYADGISDALAYGKSEMWFNKSLMPMYQAGLASADKNALYEWVLGRTEEHCRTCLQLNGQKHRMSEYTKRGWLPQASVLECKGFKCDCKLQRTTGRAKGRFPTASTATKHTDEVYDPDNLLNPDYPLEEVQSHV